MASIELITKEDLEQFRSELLNDLKSFLQQSTNAEDKSWLKSTEVRKLLKISPGTLQNLRVNGTLAYTKIGGTIYYKSADIEKLGSKK